ncbi:MAG TPA: SDR family NAD(P)-dependent oxidoreductase, partial [Pseudohongiella sp.]|nr:SDR family NAD(P)-dependent oxidoreductase [Pseudohongiella sp.]
MNPSTSAHKHITIIGATSGIASHCARLWASGASRMTLVARNLQALDDIAADLKVRNPALQIHCIAGEFMQPEGIQSMVASISSEAPVDTVLIAHGNLPDQSQCQQQLQQCADAIRVNALSPVLVAEAFAA